MQQRDVYFDNARFFLILLVVIGHSMEVVSGEYIYIFYRLIYLFHMPAFIIISGYFTKFQKNLRFSGLVMQYLVFQTIYCLFNIFVLKMESAIIYSTPIWILWFSLAIMIWKLITPYINKLKYPIIIMLLFAISAGYDNSIGYGLSLSRVIVFFPFFLIGYYATSEHFKLIKLKISSIAAVLVFTVSFFILVKGPHFHIGLLYHSISYQSMEMTTWYAGVFRLLFLFWSAILAMCFFALVPQKTKVFTFLGQRTLQVYILHGFVIKLLEHYHIGAIITLPAHKFCFFVGIIVLTITLSLKVFSYPFFFINKVGEILFISKK